MSRTLTFTVYEVRQFDQIGWDLMRRAMARRGAVSAPPTDRKELDRDTGVEEIALLPMLERGRGQRFRFSLEGDRADLIRFMEELEAKVGRPPAPRTPRPVQLTRDRRLQQQYREAGERH